MPRQITTALALNRSAHRRPGRGRKPQSTRRCSTGL